MAETWNQRFDQQEQRMNVAALFLTSLVEGDIDLPDEVTDQAEATLKDLSHSQARLATMRRKCNAEGGSASELMSQPTLQRCWAEITAFTDQVLNLQETLIEAHENGQVEIISQSEMEGIKGAPLSL